MPEIYTELTPPTAVTHSLTLPFTSPAASNLLVAKTNILQVFTTVTVQTSLSTPMPSDPDAAIGRRLSGDEEQGAFAGELTLQRSTVEDVCKLRLVAEFTISGEITGMVRVAAPQSTARENRVGGGSGSGSGGGGGGGGGGGDMVLVAFRDAKMSLLSWDGERQGLRTVSLHFYEREEFWSPVVSGGLPALLVADPGMRAVVLKFAGDMLAVLPVRQEGEEGEEGEEGMLDGDGDGDVDGGGDADGDVEMAGGGDGGGGKGVVDDDWDPNAMEGVVEKKKPVVNGEEKKRRSTEGKTDLPFLPSFVVSASQLDDAISHVLSLTFLHEYREPTLGILYSPKWTWTGWLEERKDTVCYIVITLDLEQKASTPIISVQGLPYDLFKVIPLSPPIGGSLLLGANEIIHIDQAGKTTGVAVNSYTKKATNFGGLADQSDLCLALEGSMVVELDGEGGDLLLLTRDGIAAIVGFRMDGRNVSGVSITTIAKHPGPLVGGLTTTAISLGERRLFVGCDEGDARLLKWKRKGEKKQATEGPLEDHDVDDIYNMLDDVDDDLYGGDGTPPDVNGARRDSVFADSDTKVGDHRTKGEYMFQTHDRIVNLGPFRSVAMGRPTYPADAVEKQRGVVPELEIIATSGPTNTPEDAGLALIRRSIAPTIVGRFNFEACKALWTVRAKSMKPSETAQATGKEEQSRNVDNEYDRYFFVSKDGESSVFRVGDTFEEVRDTDFDADGATLDVGVLGEGARIVQVVAEQVRVYDCEMNLAQIIPMMDETGDDGPAIVRARICDPYVILMRVDGSIVVYKLHKSMELEEERGEGIKDGKYKSGSLYKARKGEVVVNNSEDADFILALLTESGALQVYDLSDLSAPIFAAEHFSSLPPLLKQHPSAELTSPRTPATAVFATTEEITEILLADLGDETTKEPYLIARNAEDDIIIYKLFLTPSSPTLPSSVAFTKIPNPIISTPRPDLSEKQTHRTMVSMSDVNGYSCVFVPGSDPAFILKTAQSIPRLHRLAGSGVRSLSPFHTSSCDRGFIFIDFNGVVRVSLLPSSDWSFTSPFHSKKIYLPASIRSVAWYDPMSVIVAATTKRVPFSLDEEDGKPAAESFDPAQLHPHIDSGSLIIVSPLTHTVVDTYQFAHNEVPLIVDSIPLEISEHTHERRHLLAVGTGIFRGEDHSARGGIYVFEVIEVVPEPGRPETNRKLKLVTREEVKGTVSALCGVNGYLLAAQGQKIMIRGLKEDQSLLPVAFMDMNTYITVACSLPSSPGLLLFGDGLKSLWFCGFSEEPYKVSLFGKDADTVGVLAAEFLPDPSTGLLAFVLVDGKGNVLVLNYDHEHPKSLSGQRLMRRANFHSAHEILSLRLLPSTSSEEEEGYLLLAATRTGSLGSISMIGENSYRRLNMLQNQVVVGEEHVAGCNPKAFRHVAGTDRTGEILRGVLDRGLLERWMGLGVVRRAEMAAKAGMEVGLARGEVLGAGGMEGLGFL